MPSPPRAASEDSGLLLEIAAANMDAQEMQQRMEGMQAYCHKLERTVSAELAAAPLLLLLLGLPTRLC